MPKREATKAFVNNLPRFLRDGIQKSLQEQIEVLTARQDFVTQRLEERQSTLPVAPPGSVDLQTWACAYLKDSVPAFERCLAKIDAIPGLKPISSALHENPFLIIYLLGRQSQFKNDLGRKRQASLQPMVDKVNAFWEQAIDEKRPNSPALEVTHTALSEGLQNLYPKVASQKDELDIMTVIFSSLWFKNWYTLYPAPARAVHAGDVTLVSNKTRGLYDAVVNPGGFPPAVCAAYQGKLEALCKLDGEQLAITRSIAWTGETALTVAAKKQNDKMVEFLIGKSLLSDIFLSLMQLPDAGRGWLVNKLLKDARFNDVIQVFLAYYANKFDLPEILQQHKCFTLLPKEVQAIDAAMLTLGETQSTLCRLQVNIYFLECTLYRKTFLWVYYEWLTALEKTHSNIKRCFNQRGGRNKKTFSFEEKLQNVVSLCEHHDVVFSYAGPYRPQLVFAYAIQHPDIVSEAIRRGDIRLLQDIAHGCPLCKSRRQKSESEAQASLSVFFTAENLSLAFKSGEADTMTWFLNDAFLPQLVTSKGKALSDHAKLICAAWTYGLPQKEIDVLISESKDKAAIEAALADYKCNAWDGLYDCLTEDNPKTFDRWLKRNSWCLNAENHYNQLPLIHFLVIRGAACIIHAMSPFQTQCKSPGEQAQCRSILGQRESTYHQLGIHYLARGVKINWGKEASRAFSLAFTAWFDLRKPVLLVGEVQEEDARFSKDKFGNRAADLAVMSQNEPFLLALKKYWQHFFSHEAYTRESLILHFDWAYQNSYWDMLAGLSCVLGNADLYGLDYALRIKDKQTSENTVLACCLLSREAFIYLARKNKALALSVFAEVTKLILNRTEKEFNYFIAVAHDFVRNHITKDEVIASLQEIKHKRIASIVQTLQNLGSRNTSGNSAQFFNSQGAASASSENKSDDSAALARALNIQDVTQKREAVIALARSSKSCAFDLADINKPLALAYFQDAVERAADFTDGGQYLVDLAATYAHKGVADRVLLHVLKKEKETSDKRTQELLSQVEFQFTKLRHIESDPQMAGLCDQLRKEGWNVIGVAGGAAKPSGAVRRP